MGLKEKYEKVDFDNLKEKQIIYFCRDSLNHRVKESIKIKYEKELLEIIKSKDWDWFAKDIDGNILLTYPIYNNNFSIVEYLINNKKYDLTKFNSDISDALSACINLIGESPRPEGRCF